LGIGSAGSPVGLPRKVTPDRQPVALVGSLVPPCRWSCMCRSRR